ncbi:uncharacterized protein LOC109976674 isoform X2 [Xyrichtys novacula]|uniref:Uncharacterized protein LOC109976674 isoform X2 n=1 Tax=Xyrichtys novacula TaxID=13765 RepID=A0AAV1GYJ6_XYRNO|nr:uncharacterized protein LOC109976674 isoform X2 [Xyrichtys novacula]
MTLLGLILVLVTLFEVASSREEIHRVYQPGQDVILPCGPYSSRGPQCSNIGWLYNRDFSSETKNVVSNGKVDPESRRAARLNVNTDCSLVIRQTTAEDFGLYTCRPFDNDHRFDVPVYLSHLNISSLVQMRDDEVTLECSLLRYEGLPECRQNPLRWVDDTGSELSEGVSKLNNRTNLFSRLTVKRQSGNNRRYVCQYVNKENHVAIQAEYTPVFTDPGSTASIYIIVGALMGVLLLLVVMTTVLIKYRKRTKVTEDVQKQTQPPEEPDSDVTYVTVSHKQQEASKKKAEKEEEVTYSAIRSAVTMEIHDDSSSLYSSVSKPRR